MKDFFISLGEVYNDRIGMVRMMLTPAFFAILFSLDLAFYFICFFLSFFFSVAITMSELKQKKLEVQNSPDQTKQNCESEQDNESSSDKKNNPQGKR